MNALTEVMAERVVELTHQRDELVAALKALADHFLADENGMLPPDLFKSAFFNDEIQDVYEQVLTALANAKESTK